MMDLKEIIYVTESDICLLKIWVTDQMDPTVVLDTGDLELISSKLLDFGKLIFTLRNKS